MRNPTTIQKVANQLGKFPNLDLKIVVFLEAIDKPLFADEIYDRFKTHYPKDHVIRSLDRLAKKGIVEFESGVYQNIKSHE